MNWMCEPYYTVPLPLFVLGWGIFFGLGFYVALMVMMYSKYDFEKQYEQWKKDRGLS